MNNNTAPGQAPKIIKGRKPNTRELMLLKLGFDIFKQSPDHADNIAKTLITLITTLITIYISILAFLQVSERASTIKPSWVYAMLIPIIFWIISICFNVKVYLSDLAGLHLNRPENIQDYMNFIIKNKNKHLRWGGVFFFVGLLSVVFIVIYSSHLASSDLDSSVQFVINEDYLPTFENISIDTNNQTRITTSLTLVEEGDSFYKVRLENGKIIKFNKNMVEGVIYD